MTFPAGPQNVILQFANVNAMATAPIQNLSSATNNVLSTGSVYPNVPAPAAGAGALPPVYSKSGIIAFVEAEQQAGRPPYFRLDPTSLANVSLPIFPLPDPAYPYGYPGPLSPSPATVIAAQSSLVYDLASNDPFAAPISSNEPVHDPQLPGRWYRLNVADATVR